MSPQSESPVGHIAMHDPPTQICEPGHAVPHAPQLLGSVATLVQLPEQLVRPAAQVTTHAPAEHT